MDSPADQNQAANVIAAAIVVWNEKHTEGVMGPSLAQYIAGRLKQQGFLTAEALVPPTKPVSP